MSAQGAYRPPEETEEERRYPSTIGGAIYLIVLAAVVVGIWLTVDVSWRLGIRVVSAALLSTAVARLMLPARDAGMLAVRNKWIDALFVTTLGVIMIVLASSIPDQPLS